MLEEICKTRFDIIWSFDNSVFFDFAAAPKATYCISHIVDWNQDFEFEKASKSANICLATSNFIVKKQLDSNHNSYNIGHGYNEILSKMDRFKLNGLNTVQCGYAGNLDIKYINWDLVEKLVNSYENVDFNFAGKWETKNNYSNLLRKSNFHYYGMLAADKLPIFYEEMDILILVYLNKRYPKQLANPHKMMEYLASGKMIFATWTEEYSHLSDEYVKLVVNESAFESEFKVVVDSLHYWNSDSLQNKRKEFVKDMSYQRQLKKIEELIN
jgi:hypothetical protein